MTLVQIGIATVTLHGLLMGEWLTISAQNGSFEREAVKDAGRGRAGSPYIPVDSWIYEAVLRLHNLGYVPTLYLNLRPYTRVSLAHALRLSEDSIRNDEELYGRDDEAVEIFARLKQELAPEFADTDQPRVVAESQYARLQGVAGPPLNDSFHLGQTFVNDYGRPFQQGIDGLVGASGYATAGRFNLYVRGEYQHAPGATGYNADVSSTLQQIDGLPQGPHFDIPEGQLPQINRLRLLEANASMHLLGHQLSFGRSDDWLGPASGGAMAWSNNAEPIYSFRINRIEPLYLPLVSRFAGPFRYEFFVGTLKGHDAPNAPWVHMEKASFKPFADLEFGFSRTVLWGGEGHVPITFGTFFRSFFSPAGVQADVKFSRADPGARFSSFDFNYRMPWRQHLVTIYSDSFVHDAVFPISNPVSSSWRPGLVVNRLPHMPRVDLRAEASYTDVKDYRSIEGRLMLYEVVQQQGYTNRSFLLGDWIGRENKGGNATVTWHLRPDQMVQVNVRTVKAAKDFIPDGTTQEDLGVTAVLRPMSKLELRTSVQQELWRARLLQAQTQHSTSFTVHATYFYGPH